MEPDNVRNIFGRKSESVGSVLAKRLRNAHAAGLDIEIHEGKHYVTNPRTDAACKSCGISSSAPTECEDTWHLPRKVGPSNHTLNVTMKTPPDFDVEAQKARCLKKGHTWQSIDKNGKRCHPSDLDRFGIVCLCGAWSLTRKTEKG